MQLREDHFVANLAVAGVDGRARAVALEKSQAVERHPTPAVSYEATGFVLVVGAEEVARRAARRLGPPLECLILATDTPKDDADAPGEHLDNGPETPLLYGSLVELSGYLGQFTALLDAGGDSVDLLRLAAQDREHIDIVLDLTVPPQIRSEIPPVGYFAPQSDPAALNTALREIPSLVGYFEKPRYFDYDPDICAHSRSGLKACTRCIDACPTGAIHSNGDQGIEIDIHLCQGAGSCATACPSGAVRYAYPRLSDTLEQLRTLLRVYRETGGSRAILLFHDREEGSERLAGIAERLPEHVVPIAVEETGSVGMDLWLAALAYGAVRVILLGNPGMAASVVSEIDAQLSFARTLLDGMGYPPEGLAFMSEPDDEKLLVELAADAPFVRAQPASFAALDEKRTIIRLALEHLYQQAPAPRPMITLPTGAPFGDVWLVEDRCTLCMACVSQCPGKALMAGDELPQLKFMEENCVQCGICARACPENAIAPSPRYLFDTQARRKLRLLKEEEPFLCIRCGIPFATHSVIQRVSMRLKGNPNLTPADFKRLQMCEDCRVKALFEHEQTQVAGAPGERPL